MWAAVLAASLGCYVLKLAGLSVPKHILAEERVQRIAALLPVALLATLIVLQTFSTGHRLTVDARAAGLAAAATAQMLRAPFLVVVVVACAVAALVHLVS